MIKEDLIAMAPNGDCIDHGRGLKRRYAPKWVNGTVISLHRFLYCEAKGITLESIKGLVVRHTCDNHRCINIEHLVIGTHADNMADKSVRRRHSASKLTIEQVADIRANCKPSGPKSNQPNEQSCCAFARKYGVSSGTISKIMRGGSYKHDGRVLDAMGERT